MSHFSRIVFLDVLLFAFRLHVKPRLKHCLCFVKKLAFQTSFKLSASSSQLTVVGIVDLTS